MVGVDNFRCAEFGKRLLKDFLGMTRLQSDRNFVRKHLAASHIDHSGQVNKAFGHGNVGGVQCPDPVSPDDGQVPEQVGLDLVAGLSLAGAWLVPGWGARASIPMRRIKVLTCLRPTCKTQQAKLVT